MGNVADWLPAAVVGGADFGASLLGSDGGNRRASYGHNRLAPTRGGIDQAFLGRPVAAMESMGAALAGRAAEDFTAPLAQVGPNSQIWTGYNWIGTPQVDLAQQQPGLLGTPGLNFGQKGFFSGQYDPSNYRGVGQRNLGTIPQVPPVRPQVGGGLPQMQGIMGLLGVHSDPMGNLFMDRTQLFTGGGDGSDQITFGEHDDTQPSFCPPGTTYSDLAGGCVPNLTYGDDGIPTGLSGNNENDNLPRDPRCGNEPGWVFVPDPEGEAAGEYNPGECRYVGGE